MLADREAVVGLLSHGMPEKAARDALDRYLADAGCSARMVTVEPGTHHLYSAGEADDFGDLASAADLDLAMPEAFRPILVVSPRPLSPEPGAPRP